MKSLKEVDGELTKHWYIAALSRELVPGRVLGRTVYDDHYALFRDENGSPRAVEDRCLHRGAKLSEGRCEKGRLSCPYHGWTYDASGVVTDIPSEGPSSAEREAAVRERNWRVPSAPVVERDGAIWIWAGGGEADPATPTWRFPFHGDTRWTQYFMITDFDNEVTNLVQNFMDVPHTVFVHSKWFRDQKLMEVPYTLETGEGRVKATYHKPKDTIGYLGRVINPDRLPMCHTDEFIFPNVTRVDYRFGEHGFIINSQCTPVTRYKTRVYTWIAYRGSWFAPFFKPIMGFYTRRVIEQDVVIMANQGSNLQRFGDRAMWNSTAADEIHLAITRLREKGVSDPKAAVARAITRKDRTFWI